MGNKIIDDLFSESIDIRNKEYKESLSSEYQFGYFVGLYIINRYLPTTSIDYIKSNRVISTTIGEFDEYQRLDKIWEINPSKENWNNLREYSKLIEKKYLPSELICTFDIMNISDENEFKRGLTDSLFNSDICSYSLKDEDIIIEDDESLYFTNIKFKLGD